MRRALKRSPIRYGWGFDSAFRDEGPGRRFRRRANAVGPDHRGHARAVQLEKPTHRDAVRRLLEDVGARFVDLREERLPDGLAHGHSAEHDVRNARQLALEETQLLL